MRALILGAALAAAATPALAEFTLSSTNIKSGSPMALAQVLGSCNGRKISPALTWSGETADTQRFASPVRRSTDVSWCVARKPATTAPTGGAVPGGNRPAADPAGSAAARSPPGRPLRARAGSGYSARNIRADLGQAHAPSGAVQQTHAKRGFQRLDLIADRCRRHVEAARDG